VIFIESASSTPNLWPDVLAFLSSLVASLAWPIAVVFLLLNFRTGVVNVLEAIKDRMPSMERVKTPWLEASWSTDAVKDLSKDVENLGPAHSTSDADLLKSIPAQLARVKPAAGVIDAFLEVERQVRRYLKAAGSKQSRMGSPIMAFRKDADVPGQLKNAVYELSTLRNAAAHGVGDITLESALEYTRNASRVAREIESLADDLVELL
jgi:hypothetical protein